MSRGGDLTSGQRVVGVYAGRMLKEHACLANLGQGTVCKILDQDEVKPHKVRYYTLTH